MTHYAYCWKLLELTVWGKIDRSCVKNTWGGGGINKTKGTYKNKERVYLSTLKKTNQHFGGTKTTEFNAPDKEATVIGLKPSPVTTHTYADGEETTIYDIVMLKSKEMKWSRESERKISSTFDESELPPPFFTNRNDYLEGKKIISERDYLKSYAKTA